MSCNTCNCNKSSNLNELGIDTSLLNPCFEKYANIEGSLISVLQTAQDLYGYLPMSLLEYIAERMKIKASKVVGVATFYSQFRTQPVGKFLILICQGTACHVNGSKRIEEAISNHLGIAEGEISEDGLFSYNNVACLGCCSLAPAIMIGERVYGNLDKSAAVKILDETRRGEA